MLVTSFQVPDYDPLVLHFARYAMWLVCIGILKIVNWNRYHPLDKRYRFSISVQPEITPLLMVFYSMLKKCSQRLAGLWLVGKVVNHVGFMNMRWSRVAWRSNVGLVLLCKNVEFQFYYYFLLSNSICVPFPTDAILTTLNHFPEVNRLLTNGW